MRVIIIVIMCLILCGCDEGVDARKEFNKLSQEKIETIMNENEYVIIDVRTKNEYDEGHLVESVNIPYDEINEDIEIDKDKIIFVYCKSGNRSKIAYDILLNLGYVVYDLGGFDKISLPKE